MSFILQELGPDGPVAEHVLKGPGPIVIGRGRDAAIRFADTRISRHHCALTYQNDQCHVEDLNSANGTQLNHQTIQKAALSEGDTLCTGRIELRFMKCADSATYPVATLPDRAESQVASPEPGHARGIPTVVEPAQGKAAAVHVAASRYAIDEVIHQGSTVLPCEGPTEWHDGLPETVVASVDGGRG